MSCEQTNEDLEQAHSALQALFQKLHNAHIFKVNILKTALIVDACELALGVWNMLDEQEGLEGAVLGMGVLSVGLSVYGLFRHKNIIPDKKDEPVQTPSLPV
ncbi:hypothetical protein [Legionella impletisoli]|uniref:Uncharacterized protein n=1 Tax=Legionella impletisoli TaxID=343510 RepID=A0A917NAJ0_9GAMM|nr:hypothetical protein [Legionella impletisoli]GGI78066.1 hypothetical protein GCM10007966_03440 [Legionella impletisoli]